jgi:RPA family protein
MAEKKRLVAERVRICDIVNGVFFHGSKEEMRASYVITAFGEKISRVNVIGSVTDVFLSENGNYGSVTVDDGTATVRAKVFGDGVSLIKDVAAGNLVLVVGKVKEYNGEIYVNAEIVRRIEDPNYENLRKLEILKRLKEKKKMVEEIRGLVDQMSDEELNEHARKKYGLNEESLRVVRENLKVVKEIDYKPRILEMIKSMDKGDGVEVSKIFEVVDLPEKLVENAINELSESGALYEPRVGILKVV